MDLSNDAFLRTSDFAEEDTYTNEAGTSKKINAIFTAPGQVQVVNGVPVINNHATFLCDSSDVADATVKATITRPNGDVYYVRQPLPDGTGMTTIVAGRDE